MFKGKLMALDYLSICNAVLNSVNEDIFQDQTEFDAATGVHQFIKNAVNWSISEIYRKQDNKWPFQSATLTQVLATNGTVEYTLPADCGSVDWNSFYIAKDALLDHPDARDLELMPWVRYREALYMSDLNADSTSYTKPSYVVRTPVDTYIISGPAEEAYTVKAFYFTKFSKLVEYDDTTDIPDEFENVIVDGALKRVYEFRSDEAMVDKKEQQFEDGVKDMRRILIPMSESMVVRN